MVLFYVLPSPQYDFTLKNYPGLLLCSVAAEIQGCEA